MNISPLLKTSFGAQLVHQDICNYKDRKFIENPSLSKVLVEYDKAISDITTQRENVLKLDEFMHSDEIKGLVEKLPREDKVIIKNRYHKDGGSELLKLSYSTLDPLRIKSFTSGGFSSECSVCTADESDIDRNKIVDWLKMLRKIVYKNY